MKEFGDILTDSWNEYKTGFKIFFIILLLLSLIPSIILFVPTTMLNSQISQDSTNLFLFMIYFFPLIIIGSVLGIWLVTSITYYSIHNKKRIDVKKSLLGGLKYFWRYLGLGLFIVLIMFTLTIAPFIIPLLLITLGFQILGGIFLFIAIIVMFIMFIFLIKFLISWSFSSYVLIGENASIIESLRKSSYLIKGKWWRTFVYIMLLFLIMTAIQVIIFVINLVINLILGVPIFSTEEIILTPVFILSSFIGIILSFIMSLITFPLGILFIKNMYLDYGSKKTKPK